MHGYNVILCNTNQEIAIEAAQIKTLFERQVDGIIISVADEKAEHLDNFKRKDKPVIFINRSPERSYGNIVLTDNYQGAYEAISYLVTLGHRRIGIVGCSPNYITGRERLGGYLEALKDHNIQIDESLIVKATIHNRDMGYEAAMTLLGQSSMPTAILGAIYYSNLGVLTAIRKLNLRIPEDISAIGFDDSEWSECYNLPLTTVAQLGKEIRILTLPRTGMRNFKSKTKIY